MRRFLQRSRHVLVRFFFKYASTWFPSKPLVYTSCLLPVTPVILSHSFFFREFSFSIFSVQHTNAPVLCFEMTDIIGQFNFALLSTPIYYCYRIKPGYYSRISDNVMLL